MNKFQCSKCSSNELSYEKWVNCREDVVINSNGHIEYCLGNIDETNELGAVHGYVCRKCNFPLYFRNSRIENEDGLKFYLSKSPDEIRAIEEDDEEQEVIEELIREEAADKD